MNEYEDSDVSPIAYLKIFFRRKELILIPAFAGLVLGICTGIILPKKYRSSTVILVEEGKSDNPLFNKIAVSTTVRQRMAGVKESILGWNSMVEVVRRLRLDKDVKSKAEFEKLIVGLRERIIIRLKGNNILHLDYIGYTPENTRDVVKTITEIFVGKNIRMQTQATQDAINFIEEQLQVYKGKIKSAEIAQLSDQLDTILIDSTEDHPMVKQLRDQLNAKKEELKKENLEFTENLALEPASTSPIIDEIKRALDNLEGTTMEDRTIRADSADYYKVMLIDKMDSVLARDAGVNNQIYNMLLQRLETARITQRLQSSKEGTRYTVLDPPRIPLKPFKPNRILVALIGMFFGGIFGVALVVAVEFLDKSFIDVEDAKNYLGVALFGAISKINTADSVRRDREKQFWMYSLSLVCGILAVVATVVVTDFLSTNVH